MRNNYKSSRLRFISFIVAILLALPFSWKGVTGFYTWLSPFIMLNSVLSLKSFVWLNLLTFPILLFVLFRRRWFCNNLCPLGFSLDMISRLNRREQFTYNRLPDIGKWAAIISLAAAIFGFPIYIILDPMAIFNGFFTIISLELSLVGTIFLLAFLLLIFIHLILPGIWCSKLCPLGGLQLALDDMKNAVKRFFSKSKPESMKVNTGRRYFILSGLGLLTGIAIPKFLKIPAESLIRPPAALKPLFFYCLCCRCGNCIKACPTGIIIPDTDFGNILSWMTPKISFKKGYCLETCNVCSQVCPSGAITLFSIGAKSHLIMGIAEIQPENCLLSNNTECIKCKESCKYNAIKFIYKENGLNSVPVIDIKKCVGCGACKVVCPAKCIEINKPDF